MDLEESVAAEICPLCGKNNQCGQLCSGDNKDACWCASGELEFPESLLNRVSNAAKNRACICKACALKHMQDGDT